jgi:hypothetical protein
MIDGARARPADGKNPPLMPEGSDQKITRVWVPKCEQFETLNVKRIEEQNETFGYRQ